MDEKLLPAVTVLEFYFKSKAIQKFTAEKILEHSDDLKRQHF